MTAAREGHRNRLTVRQACYSILIGALPGKPGPAFNLTFLPYVRTRSWAPSHFQSSCPPERVMPETLSGFDSHSTGTPGPITTPVALLQHPDGNAEAAARLVISRLAAAGNREDHVCRLRSACGVAARAETAHANRTKANFHTVIHYAAMNACRPEILI